jgi:hypothetical protein
MREYVARNEAEIFVIAAEDDQHALDLIDSGVGRSRLRM